jgi:hypothetical protein
LGAIVGVGFTGALGFAVDDGLEPEVASGLTVG